MTKTSKNAAQEAPQPSMDDVLKRMLSTPPQPHVKKKPADKPAEKKPAK
jgi:hypothetical protein